MSELPIPGATNILATATASRWFSRLVRRVFWQYVQTERSQRYPDSEGNVRLEVVEHDTWSKIFGCFPLGRRPIEMRIQRIRDLRDNGVSVYMICDPLREVPTFEFPDDISDLYLDLKSAQKDARRLVKSIRRSSVERQRKMATAAMDAWSGQSGRIRTNWDRSES